MSSTPTAAAANAAALATMTALVTAANTAWINDANTVIENAMNVQGKFFVTLTITKHVSIHDIVVYFRNLGYHVHVPINQHEFSGFDFLGGWSFGPFFPYEWYIPFLYERNFCNCKNPCALVISWQQGPYQF